MAASVKARLLAIAREREEDFNFVLIRFALERLLVRLALSPHADAFVLKGAMLFTVWSQRPHRATKDIDLLGQGSADPHRLEEIFKAICAAAAPEDGLVYQGHTVQAEPIREDAIYDGIRVTFDANLGSARIPIQVDVGFGDAIEPPPELVEVPPLLNFPAPKLKGYRRETVVAEKLHAMVDLGMANSRMKDFFDIWFLSHHFPFDGPTLAFAVASTFRRRETPVLTSPPLALTSTFSSDPTKQVQWSAFAKRTRLDTPSPTLQQVVEELARFLIPVITAAAMGPRFEMKWPTGGPWVATS